jgi:hypothetical protein
MKQNKVGVLAAIAAASLVVASSAWAQTAPTWQAGSAYKAGDKVQGTDGKTYECKPWPYTGWCGLATYNPSGSYSSQAWTLSTQSAGASTTATTAATTTAITAPTAAPTTTVTTTTTTTATAISAPSSSGDSSAWVSGKVYDKAGTQVTYNGERWQNAWWTNGQPGSDPAWKKVTANSTTTTTTAVATSPTPAPTTAITTAAATTVTTTTPTTTPTAAPAPSSSSNSPAWVSGKVYDKAGTQVTYNGVLWKNGWWTNGQPGIDAAWQKVTATTTSTLLISTSPNTTAAPAPSTTAAPTTTLTTTTTTTATAAPAPTPTVTLPAGGYALLNKLTDEHWNWLFPLRSGRYNAQGGARNLPPIANPDGSTDAYTLSAFKTAVLAYNTWAQSKNQAQFLNEGSLKQQAEEFAAFWGKSARETGGAWAGAPAPWIEDYQGGKVWKGGLYWTEEMGYSTNADGTSAAVGYVDSGNTQYPAVPGRSYHGRGPIQLSWNYNYGGFSYWLYDNGLLKDVITSRDALLKNPGLVASDGRVAVLSALWFWMTPQGAKPASHDVILGKTTIVSTTSQQTGFAPLRNGFSINGKTTPPTAAGDTTDIESFAYRLGVVINIVNGGLECNGAASTHTGPSQRVSYYSAFAQYLNDKLSTGANRFPALTNIWGQPVSTNSPTAVQSATCFNQKAYYSY